MTRQELLKQADYTFQRGNRELAKKYLSEYLASYPDDEAAWLLMAKITGEKAHQIACFERALKLNPNNIEAKIGLVRVQSTINPTLPLNGASNVNTDLWKPKATPYRNALRGALIVIFLFVLFGTTGLVIARNNPSSRVAQLLTVATPTLATNAALAQDIAPQMVAEVNASYPEYAPLMDALLGLAVSNAENGMEGAPERPGDEIIISEQSGMEAESLFENSMPQPGSLASITITEQQMTSWLAMQMQGQSDLPFSSPQVYLRDGKIQVWGIVTGSESTTATLIIGEVKIDSEKRPYFDIETMQIGQQVLPDFVTTQMEAWLNQMLLDGLEKQAPGLELMNVKVTSGLITISGMR